MPDRLPVVAVIGRPNVGKSTLFNRIVGRRHAIVHDQPGVTRDRLYQRVDWEGSVFRLVDTGGFDLEAAENRAATVTDQAMKAVAEADAVIFLVDAAAGLTPQDRDIAALLRKEGRKVFLAANKVDSLKRAGWEVDFHSLGFFPVYPLSAEHGTGIGDLLEALTGDLPRGEEAAEPSGAPRLTVVGRPNVGKSTLVNRLLGEERLITHPEPGTTRDAVDTVLRLPGREYVLVDTAGIRKRGRVQAPVEKYSVMRAKEAIDRSDICLLLLDATEMVTEQDTKVAGLILEASRGCIILVNKWDAAGGNKDEAARLVRQTMPFMDFAPLLFISGMTGLGVYKILPLVDRIHGQLKVTIPTPELNRFLHDALTAYKPASFHGKAVSLGYMTQVRMNPPTFVILTNEPSRVHLSYRRYLVNRFREAFGYQGLPLTFRFRGRERKKRGSREGRPKPNILRRHHN